MKKYLLLLSACLILMTMVSKSYGQFPPPCGFSPSYACDENGDGFEQINLVEVYPFDFCNQNPEDYYPTTYYTNENDAINGENAISNPTAFINIINPQPVYFRAEPIDPNVNDVLINSEYFTIMPQPTANTPEPLIVCDLNNNGFETFNLLPKKYEILAGQNTGYSIAFFETFDDAVNLNFQNTISNNNYVNTIAYQQTIYASVYVIGDTDCVAIAELDLIVQGQCEDLAVYLTNDYVSPRPGFDYINYLFVENNGSKDIALGTVEFVLDGNLQLITATSTNPENTVTVNGTGVTLDFFNLDIGETNSVQILMHCPSTLILGEQVTNTASYLSNSEDVNLLNDFSILSETVIGSYDPNNVMESHGPIVMIDEFTADDYLYYTIRFQNVGTASAEDIRIENVLDDQIDESTFQMINSSHASIINRLNNSVAWQFNNINLPPESQDEPNSHGFVHFKVKPNVGYAVGDIIPNTASIYFDFNVPVITNTYETEFVETLSTANFNQLAFNLYPNPAQDVVNISFANALNGFVKIKIINLQGSLVKEEEQSVRDNSVQLDVSKLSSGIYFMEVTEGSAKQIRKLVIE